MFLYIIFLAMGEIHARTNALGLPFTVDGELIGKLILKYNPNITFK